MRRATWTKPSPWGITAAALVSLIAACTTPTPPPPPQAALPPPPQEPLPKPPPRKPAPPSAAGLAPAASPTTPVEATQVEPEAPPPAASSPPMLAAIEPPPATQPPPARPRLIGLNQPEVAELLGEPKSRAEAPPATIWRYDGSDCALDVYFYFDLQSQAMRALHYEVRSHDAAERSAQRCYETLLSERRATADPTGGADHPR